MDEKNKEKESVVGIYIAPIYRNVYHVRLIRGGENDNTVLS